MRLCPCLEGQTGTLQVVYESASLLVGHVSTGHEKDLSSCWMGAEFYSVPAADHESAGSSISGHILNLVGLACFLFPLREAWNHLTSPVSSAA